MYKESIRLCSLLLELLISMTTFGQRKKKKIECRMTCGIMSMNEDTSRGREKKNFEKIGKKNPVKTSDYTTK